MAEKRLLKKQSLGALFEKLRAAGRRILAPRQKDDQIAFAEVSSPGEMAQDYLQTTVSAKGVVLPRCEELFRYRFEGKDVKIEDSKFDPPATVLFGLRPCDARSFAVLASVFNWDYQDKFFNARRAKTAIIGVSCTRADEYCFCTSLDGGPGDPQGSDILLTPLAAGDYLAEILTDKGKEIEALAPDLFGPAGSDHKDAALAKVPVRFDIKDLEKKLPALFAKDALWVEQSLRCLGCGSCAFLCPCCVCFDIQDEKNRDGGVRLRCADSCGFGQFTLHTSGHNPRDKQSQRWRQRIMHKFSYFDDRLKYVGCVGCGRCSRACPADMNIVEHIQALAEAAV